MTRTLAPAARFVRSSFPLTSPLASSTRSLLSNLFSLHFVPLLRPTLISHKEHSAEVDARFIEGQPRSLTPLFSYAFYVALVVFLLSFHRQLATYFSPCLRTAPEFNSSSRIQCIFYSFFFPPRPALAPAEICRPTKNIREFLCFQMSMLPVPSRKCFSKSRYKLRSEAAKCVLLGSSSNTSKFGAK